MFPKKSFFLVIFLLGILIINLVCVPLPGTPPAGETSSAAETTVPPKFNGVQAATATSTPVPLPVLAQPTVTPTRVAGLPPLSIPDVVDMVKPAVVSIGVKVLGYDMFLRPIPEEGAGSGFIINNNGYIVTNNHVIEGSQNIKVTLEDGRSFDGAVVGTDVYTDVAVVKINADNLPTIKLGDSKKLRVGEWVVALGNALGLEGGPTVTAGIVSYLGRQIQEPNTIILTDLIQTDAAINPGNSGGPLVNLAGEVVGMNTAIASGAENIGFAVSISTFQPVVQELIAKGRVDRPYLGVEMQTVTPSVARSFNLSVTKGALLTRVAAGSPAEKAGLKRGDVVTKYNNKNVEKAEDLRQAIIANKIGDTVTIVFIRDNKEQTTSAQLVARP